MIRSTSSRRKAVSNVNVGQITDDSGNIVARYEYDPYGNALVADGIYAAENPFRFSTKYLDAETGLYYYGFRYYSSELGRWLSRDPIGESGGQNLFAYCHNNSNSWGDPLGLKVLLGPFNWIGDISLSPLKEVDGYGVAPSPEKRIFDSKWNTIALQSLNVISNTVYPSIIHNLKIDNGPTQFGLAVENWLKTKSKHSGIHRTEFEKTLLKIDEDRKIVLKLGVIAQGAIPVISGFGRGGVSVSGYGNLAGSGKIPIGISGFSWVLEPSIGISGKMECAECAVGGAWEFKFASLYCRGDVKVNLGLKLGLQTPGLKGGFAKIYAEAGAFIGAEYSFRRNDLRVNYYAYAMAVFSVNLGDVRSVNRRAEYRIGSSVDF